MTTGRGGDARRGSGRGPGASNRRLRDVDARRFVVTMKERSTTRSERSSWGFTGDGSGRVVADAERFSLLGTHRSTHPSSIRLVVSLLRGIAGPRFASAPVSVCFANVDVSVRRGAARMGARTASAVAPAARGPGPGRSADASDGVGRVGADCTSGRLRIITKKQHRRSQTVVSGFERNSRLVAPA